MYQLKLKEDILETDYRAKGKDDRLYAAHNDLSIEIIQTWSSGGFFMAKNNIFPIETGSVFLINAIENHASNPNVPEHYIRNKLIVSRNFFMNLVHTVGLEEIVWKPLNEEGGLHFNFASTPTIANNLDVYFQQADKLYSTEMDAPLSHAKISSIVTQILITLFTEHHPVEPSLDKSQKTLHTIMEYINNHSSSWSLLTLDAISKNLHISPSYLSHLFKRTTGQSLMQFISERRIAEAKKLLINTDTKIQAISDLLEYGNCTVFCKTFKKNTQMTPKEYRHKNRI